MKSKTKKKTKKKLFVTFRLAAAGGPERTVAEPGGPEEDYNNIL